MIYLIKTKQTLKTDLGMFEDNCEDLIVDSYGVAVISNYYDDLSFHCYFLGLEAFSNYSVYLRKDDVEFISQLDESFLRKLKFKEYVLFLKARDNSINIDCSFSNLTKSSLVNEFSMIEHIMRYA